jgi:hypothetical protein
VDPVPERLAGHAGEPRRPLARQAVEGVGEPQQPAADPTVALAAGEAAQLARVTVGAGSARVRARRLLREEGRRNASAARSIRHQFGRPV